MMHLLKRRRAARYGLALLAVLFIGLLGFVHPQLARGRDQDIQKLNRFVQTAKTDTPAMRLFREGRDLIEAEDWARAADKFNSFVSSYPHDKDVDAALYWLAYALKKQGHTAEARSIARRLVNEFPRSTWRQEAEAMLTELGDQGTVNDALRRDNCELKVIALQSLFEADEDRAVDYVKEALQSKSEDCPGLKAAAVSLLGSHAGPRAVPLLLDIARNQSDLKLRLTAIRQLGDNDGGDAVADDLVRLYDADHTLEIRAQILRALGEMHSARADAKLIELARSGDAAELRLMAIRILGERDTSAALAELIRLYDADQTLAVRVQVMRGLADSNDPRARAKLLDIARHGETPELRVQAIRLLGDSNRGEALNDLLQLYADESNQQIKLGLIRAYADMNDPRARAKLYEIARGTDALELRLAAIRQLGDRNNEQTTQELINLYDAERDIQVKATLIHSFGDSQQKAAVRKLISIARSDQSVELRKMAVHVLGESKDPEALKFLEELLK